MTRLAPVGQDRTSYLIVPGLDGSGQDHWQTRWERERLDCERVELGRWHDPDPRIWVERLDAAISARQNRSLILVAHSLGCHVVAWWARLFEQRPSRRIAGALLVAPPDVQYSQDKRLRRFAPMPTRRLPFRSIVVASRNDPYASLGQSEAMADRLGADFVDIGPAGHINAGSNLGAWAEGQELLASLSTPLRSARGKNSEPLHHYS